MLTEWIRRANDYAEEMPPRYAAPVLYKLAALEARRGHSDEALRLLTLARKKKFGDVNPRADEDFVSLGQLAAFRAPAAEWSR